MIFEALSWYAASVAAFWTSLARGGFLHLLVIGFVIWWLCCRRGRSFCCASCRCWCGRCKCGEAKEEDEDEG